MILKFYRKNFFLESNDFVCWVHGVYTILISNKDIVFLDKDDIVITMFSDYTYFSSVGYIADEENHFIIYNHDICYGVENED